MLEVAGEIELKPSYREYINHGDIVKMPDGTVAVVTRVEILCAGHAMQAWLCPINGIIPHLIGTLMGDYRPYEGQIDMLVKIGSIYENYEA